jgi:pilus assembly protein TadC
MNAALLELLRWAAALCGGAALFLLGQFLWNARQRGLAAARALGGLNATEPWSRQVVAQVQAGMLARLPPKLRADLEQGLRNLDPNAALGPLLFQGLLVGLGAVALALWAGAGAASVAGVAAAGLPYLRLRDRAEARRRRLRADLPDALDLLAAAVQAGLGLDPALRRVAAALPAGPLAMELGKCLDELSLGRPRREAFAGLEARAGVRELGSVLRALLRSEARGVPLAPVLQAQSEQLRRLRSLAVQKRAAEAPIRMLLPLIGFILPVVFLVVFGPVFLKLAESGF